MSIPHMEPLAAALAAELTRLWEDNGRRPFRASHRDLADALHCSPSGIHRLLTDLLARGHVIRTPHRNSYLLSLADQNDLSADQNDLSEHENADQNDLSDGAQIRTIGGRARRPDAARQSYPQNRVKTACMVYLDQDQEESLTPESESDPRARASLAQRLKDDGCNERTKIPAILTACPDLTLAEYQEQRARIPVGCGVGLLFDKLSKGQRLPPLPSAYPAAITAADVRAYGDLFVRDSDAAEVAHAA